MVSWIKGPQKSCENIEFTYENVETYYSGNVGINDDRGGGIDFDDIKQLRSSFCAVAPGIKVHNFNVN